MKIVAISPGSQGDVQPFLALGKQLKRTGHTLRLVTNSNYKSQVQSLEIDFWPIEVSAVDMIRSEKMRIALETGNIFSSMSQMGRELKDNATLIATRSLEACKDMDLILAGISGVFIAHAIAEKLNLPFVQTYNIPFTPTRAFPGVLFPKFPAWIGYHRSHLLTQQVIWQAYRPTDKIVREKVLGLRKSSIWGPFSSDSFKKGSIIYGISPSVIPRPNDWPENVHLTGFWLSDPPSTWTPPVTLTQFLQEDPKPIYIGFGSMSNRKPEETVELIVRAVQQSRQRAILYPGWGGFTGLNLPKDIMLIENIPHSWLFPRVQAVVHHGGAGTTSTGLWAGIPNIIIPFHGDQPYWGQLVAQLGVGPNPIPQKALTVDNLARTIRETTENADLQVKAAQLGEKIRTEDGITKTISILNQIKR